jgi:AraC-like DNA-binding protein
MAKTVPFARIRWIQPLPKSGKHGGPLVRLTRPRPFELSYLSWGRRHYGEPEMPPSKHEGWHYFLVLSGTPSLVVGDEEVPTGPGNISIGHPDCLIGHRDLPGRACEMLTWIWRTPPSHSALCPEKGGLLRLSLEPDQVRRMKHLHFQCREAVAECNERSLLELQAARLLGDICLVEAREHRRVADAEVRLNLAMQYLRKHAGERNLLQGLCEYLQVSKASLYRLFLERTGQGPRAFAQSWRLQWAHEQLRTSRMSIKSVAYELGYRHPPDFTRAFKHRFGVTPSSICRGTELSA